MWANRIARITTICGLLLAAQLIAQTASSQWSSVEDALGRKGSAQPGDVYKFGLPRADLHVSVNGVAVKPALALGSWLAFKNTSHGAMVMGDLVLTEDEVQPVMLKLQQGGIEQTALHNHLLNESPRVMYMHVFGHGDAGQLARTLHDALALTKTPPPAQPAAAAKLDIDQGQIEAALGRKGNPNGGVLQFAVPRAEAITMHGEQVPPSMGTATAINFQPTGSGRAAITGDFVLIGSEVNPVIKTLRENGIPVTAIHSHMIDDSPHLYFLHFWANDDAVKLAKGLRATLDRTNSQKPPTQ
jgi:Domain of Unknown Function (DUF1259)